MRFVSAPLAAAAFFGLPMAAQATVNIHIDLSRQTMHVASNQGDYDWPVSTGRPGHRTPTGVYHPQRMYPMTYSRKYDNAPMPHAIFFTGGYAIHATGAVGALGSVASHGCVRLAPANAAALYDMVRREGATIVIGGNAPGHDHVAQLRERRRASPEPVAQARENDSAGDDGVAPAQESYRESHRAGHRLAARWRQRYVEEPELAYAPQPRHHARTLRDWVNSPLENW